MESFVSRYNFLIYIPSIDNVVTAPSCPRKVLRQVCLVHILMHLSSEPKIDFEKLEKDKNIKKSFFGNSKDKFKND